MKFQPSYPIFPFALNVSNPWGKYDPATYQQFGFTRHNGIDVALAPDGLVHAPFDGTIIRTGNQPNGGGIFCGLLSDEEFEFLNFTCDTPDGDKINFLAATCYVLIDFLHMKNIALSQGAHVKQGDLIGVADNTGFTTGPHTHIQPRREYLQAADVATSPDYRYMNGDVLIDVDKNDANNSFDPTPFWTNLPAVAVPTVQSLVTQVSSITSQINTSPEITHAEKFDLLQELRQALEAIKQWF